MPCRAVAAAAATRVLCKLKSRNCWKVSNNDTYAFVDSYIHIYTFTISVCFSRSLVASIVLFFLGCAIDWEWCWNNLKSTKELRQFHLPYGKKMYEYGKFNVHAWISPACGTQHTAHSLTHTRSARLHIWNIEFTQNSQQNGQFAEAHTYMFSHEEENEEKKPQRVFEKQSKTVNHVCMNAWPYHERDLITQCYIVWTIACVRYAAEKSVGITWKSTEKKRTHNTNASID